MTTKETTHTPGPWSTEEGPENSTSVTANVSPWPTSDLPGTVAVASVPDWPACRSESNANARLIAAAPELLEALRGLVWEVEGSGDYMEGDTGNPLWVRIAAARAAIAHATRED